MKILFLTTGVSYGDAIRTHKIIEEFLKKDKKIKIKIACYNKSYEYFKDKYPVIKIQGYKFTAKRMHFKLLKFIATNYFLPISWIFSTSKLKKEAKKFKPDIIISDFEPIGPPLGLLLKVPCIFVFGYDPEVFESIPNKNAKIFIESKFFEKIYNTSKHVLIPFFLKKKSKKYHYINLIVRKSPNKLPNKSTLMKKLNLRKSPILVMLGGSSFGKLLANKIKKTAKKINEDFIIFGSDLKMKSKGNIKYYKFKENFLEYLKVSKAVITLAGQMTLAECIAYKKPMMIFPIKDHVEQLQNAYLLRNNAYVKYDLKNVEKSIKEFLNNLNKIKSLKSNINGEKQVVSYVYKLINK